MTLIPSIVHVQLKKEDTHTDLAETRISWLVAHYRVSNQINYSRYGIVITLEMSKNLLDNNLI